MQSYRGALYFLQFLEAHGATVTARIAELGGTPEARTQAFTELVLERQALSEAVQVFAAITVEGAINLYCVLLFGEPAFYGSIEKLSWGEKLKHVVSEDHPKRAAVLEELRKICVRLQNARNSFAHPKPYEGESSPPSGRRGDFESARAAVRDMQQLLDMLRKLDVRYGAYFLRL